MGAKFADGNLCNIEAQNVMDTLFLKRVRYNLAMMETRALKKGKRYKEIPLSLVVVLSPHRPVREGKRNVPRESDGE